jgi:phenylacetate-coenzyme A ligase PaaK-like adenylate-forming protein
MTKADLMRNWDAIVTCRDCTLEMTEAHLHTISSDAYFNQDHHAICSGGSSGEMGVFLYDWHGWATAAAGIARGFVRMLKKDFASMKSMVSISTDQANHATCSLLQTFAPSKRARIHAPVTLPLSRIVALLNSTQPAVVHLYPSMLPALCEATRCGALQIRPRLIWSTSEPLYPEVRCLAKSTFNVPIIDLWAASETLAGTFCCPVADGFHLSEDINIFEFVNRRSSSGGGSQPIVLLTNLYNRALPLLRYELTDEFNFSDRPCPCGSAYRKIIRVEGRSEDTFLYENNTTVHWVNFYSLLSTDPSIIDYRVRQIRQGVEVEIVAALSFAANNVRETLAQRLHSLGLPSPVVVIRRVENIPRLQSGKIKRFVSMREQPPSPVTGQTHPCGQF